MTIHWNALPEQQQKVLRACAGPAERWGAYLGGGTALALQLGHRESQDLDWFTPETLDPGELLADVKAMGFPVKIAQNDLGPPGGMLFLVESCGKLGDSWCIQVRQRGGQRDA